MTGGMAYAWAGVRQGRELKYTQPQPASSRNNLFVGESGKREWIFLGVEGVGVEGAGAEGLGSIALQERTDNKLLGTSNGDVNVAW